MTITALRPGITAATAPAPPPEAEAAPDTTPCKRPNRRSVARDRTRDRVIDAARFLFINVGYFDTSIRDIAKRIGMSTGAIFNGATNKAELWCDAVGGRAPDPALAEQVALIEALRPNWDWTLNRQGGRYRAAIMSPDYSPISRSGTSHGGHGDSAAAALAAARIHAERHDGTFPGGTVAGGTNGVRTASGTTQ